MAAKKEEKIAVERHPYRGLVLYDVTGDELDQIDRETFHISEDLTFGVVGLTTAIAFSISLATTRIESDRTFLLFWLVTIIGYAAAAFFGIRWFKGRKRRTSIVRRIKERVGPLGEKGKELEPRELAALPGQEAPNGGEETQ